MRFTVIGHACLFIEVGDTTLLVDPWLFGSCYWRSWWHFPPNTAIRPEYLTPDYVYLSHHHFDHFHFPSMRRLDRRARVLIPRFAVDIMRHEVRKLGFADVTELDHGRPLALADGLRLASFQYGIDDSALAVAANGAVLFDMNDCKMKGRVVRPLLAEFGAPTFVFKSHSWAQAYPICYQAADPREAGLLARGDYAETFYGTVRELRPRYAVPFASMVGFLHPESARCNAHAVTPPEVAAAFAASGGGATEIVVMAPGDSWDSRRGFTIADDGPWARRDEILARRAREVAPVIARATAEEASRRLAWEDFVAYFAGYLRALPPGARRLFRSSVVFHVPSSPTPYWVVDVRHERIRQESAPPADRGTLIRVPEAVLADAIAKRIVNFVHISLRITIELAPGGSRTDFLFWASLTLYEQGYLPARGVLGRRALGVWWRRRAEVAQLAASVFSRRPFAERVIGNLMTTQERGRE